MEANKWFEKMDVKKRTGREWLKKHWIPGAELLDDGSYDIPRFARIPYTQTRARGNPSVRVSVCYACAHYLGVCAELFKMEPEVFDDLIQELIKDGLIVAVEYEGIQYYNPTEKTEEYILKYKKAPQKSNIEQVKDIVEIAAPVCTTLISGVGILQQAGVI